MCNIREKYITFSRTRAVQNLFAPINILATKIRAESICTLSHVVTFRPKLEYVEKVSVKPINIRVYPKVNRHTYSDAFVHVLCRKYQEEFGILQKKVSLR
jgi:hypothetical protein